MPKHWTLAPPVADAPIVATGCFLDPDMVWDDFWFGTDGSGGVHSQDPRLRNKACLGHCCSDQRPRWCVDEVGSDCGLLVDSAGPICAQT